MNKTVATPCDEYLHYAPIWEKNKAMCEGERAVKILDKTLDSTSFSNILLPFSPVMTQQQYDFYKSEAELPAIVAQFSRMLVGGLLRKPPTLDVPEAYPSEAADWLRNSFGKDGAPLVSFLDEALWEELRTSRAWVWLSHPSHNIEEDTPDNIFPFPELWTAEEVINWRVKDEDGQTVLSQVIVKKSMETPDPDSPFHPKVVPIVYVHELDSTGAYQIREFISDGKDWNLKDTHVDITMQGKRLKFIPAWPLNGSIDVCAPLLTPLVDKEVSLYNKMSRRNHLLYGASTYTPYIASDMSEDDFQKVVGSGLGSWLKLAKGDTIGVMETPTDALKDMETAIANAMIEMAKLGIRMLSPETAQSGIALEIRNAAQTAQLGTLNTKISLVMRQVLGVMLYWKYGITINLDDIKFDLSEDFNPVPLGSEWIRLATEWYENKLLPRSVWLALLKANDLVPPEYDDDDALKEITEDSFNEEVDDDVSLDDESQQE